jgi:hypothetical protein
MNVGTLRGDSTAEMSTHLIHLELLVGSTVRRASEHGVVGLDAILGEHLRRNNGGDVEERVALQCSHTAHTFSPCQPHPPSQTNKKAPSPRTMPRRDIVFYVRRG